MSEFSHLKNKLLAEQVEDQIYHYILDEALEPGAKLPNEFALGEKFRVGRSTIREAVKLPLIYVGGLISREKMEEVLDAGFQGLQVARALVHDTDFVNKLRSGEITCSGCKHSNYCIGRMYTLEMRCHHCVEKMPKSLRREIEKAEAEL